VDFVNIELILTQLLMPDTKASILLLGCGAVGTLAAVTLERSEHATVTAVLRSSFMAVEQKGFTIDSIDHGRLTGWRPSHSAFSC
jgi:ketopantoate reductase